MGTALVIAVGVVVFFVLRRGRRAFVLRVRDGEVTVASGWLPGPMLADFRSALRGIASGAVVGHREEGGVRVTTSGDIDEGVEQRLRNITRLYPLGTMRASRANEARVAKATVTAALITAASESAGECGRSST